MMWSLLLVAIASVSDASAQICRVKHAVVAPTFDKPMFDRPQYVRATREHAMVISPVRQSGQILRPKLEQPLFVKPVISPCAGTQRVSIGGRVVSPTVFDIIQGNKSARRDPVLQSVIMAQVRPLGKASDPQRHLNVDTSILCCDGSGGVPTPQAVPRSQQIQTLTGRLR
ncbi:hypothetical protein N9B94_02880 [Verrucomicrobia bacterium]|nr:hypothetical protein [Verrucomicrobiota bacterium]